MSSASVQSRQQAANLPSSSSYPAYLDQRNHNADAYYANAGASGSGSLPVRSRQDYSHEQYPSYSHADDPSRYYESHDLTSIPDPYDGAPVPPPRSSSQQRSSPRTPVPPSTAPLEARVAAARQARQQAESSGGRDSTRDRSRDDTATAAASAARTRRKGPSSPDGPQRATSTRERSEHSNAPNQSRSEAAMLQNSAPPLVREYSEVLNRVVVSDPRVDAERVQERVAEATPVSPHDDYGTAGNSNAVEDVGPGPARRQDYSRSTSRRKDVQFGDYVLGQTLGEGEFGKVKLGWKKDGSTQVAIKLIRRDSVESHPGRLPKIYREISILRDLAHPNIVRLHEMVETERHIGIILEYASGGELFDYILNHRYLKDPAARRLFAQLVSGVGYLHKKGIVHRDLKLENLLLDQNRNIIITDFGFANTFNPADLLTDEVEYNLTNKDFVRKFKLDRLDAKGMRRGDLMQTSCGSPCYAAPELVVSDSLYTGRKVDVWSCGVILYAMLAGYLPFDDDPANPEGDNINLLYKYITTTPLTFPEYVSPHARDLLRRILVPDPRKRADLFEVARHSWLSEYHHVVSHITSSTTNIADIAGSTIAGESRLDWRISQELMSNTEPPQDHPHMHRSASVREATKPASHPTPTGMLTRTPEVDNEGEQTSSGSKKERGTRHTLQAEYVPPQSHTTRGQAPLSAMQGTTASDMDRLADLTQQTSLSKPLPQDPPRSQVEQTRSTTAQRMPPPTRPGREVPRSVSDSTGAFATAGASHQQNQYSTRPSTQGSMISNGPTRSDLRLPSRGSYGQPVAPTVATTNAQGRVTQPTKSSRGYNISGPMPPPSQHGSIGQPLAQPVTPSGSPPPQKSHHRRTSTLSGLGERLFGRSGSVRKKEEERQKPNKRYPPTAMKPMNLDGEANPRRSTDSKRSFSLGLGKKRSTDLESQNEKAGGRRFSLLPASMSLNRFMGSKESSEPNTPQMRESQMAPNWSTSRPPTGQQSSSLPVSSHDGQQDDGRPKYNNFSRPPQGQYRQAPTSQPSQPTYDAYGGAPAAVYSPNQSQTHPLNNYSPQPQYEQPRPSMQQGRQGRGVLTKPNRKFEAGYDAEPGSHGGSTGAVKKVQDFFRRRRARADSDYR
jgi:protein-serine/threonine kinase